MKIKAILGTLFVFQALASWLQAVESKDAKGKNEVKKKRNQ